MTEQESTREQELEEALKDTLFYLTLYQKEAKDKKEKVDDWAYNIEHMLCSRLGRDHSGFASLSFESVLKVWLVIEVWKDGRIVPRCISLTESGAERAKGKLIYSYESTEPSERPIISIEHQRMEHLFGWSMRRGRLRYFDGLRPRWEEE